MYSLQFCILRWSWCSMSVIRGWRWKYGCFSHTVGHRLWSRNL